MVTKPGTAARPGKSPRLGTVLRHYLVMKPGTFPSIFLPTRFGTLARLIPVTKLVRVTSVIVSTYFSIIACLSTPITCSITCRAIIARMILVASTPTGLTGRHPQVWYDLEIRNGPETWIHCLQINPLSCSGALCSELTGLIIATA